MFKMLRKNNKKNIFIIGRKGTEKVRSYTKPFISIKGEDLLNSLLIKGKYADFNSDFSNDEIYTALHKCKVLLPFPCCNNDILCENISPLSARQGFCSNATIELIMDNKYNDALHEFEDCIDDYGKGRNRYITKNELILYNCILSCFISKLEVEKGDSNCFSEKELQ